MFMMMTNENKKARGVDVVVGVCWGLGKQETEDSRELSTSLCVIKSPVGYEIYSPLPSAA